jgi:hypothetical protein
MYRSLLLIVAVGCLAWCEPLQAAIKVTAPINFVLQKDQAGQAVQITVEGDEAVAGLTFSVQIADGGPGPITQGLIDGPDITAIDILSGTVFGANNQGADDPGSYLQFATRTTTTVANTTIQLSAQPARLATVTLDTTGVAPGTYDLILGAAPSALGTTEFYSLVGNTLTPVLVNGSVVIVPEPSGLALGCLAALAAVAALKLRRAE